MGKRVHNTAHGRGIRKYSYVHKTLLIHNVEKIQYTCKKCVKKCDMPVRQDTGRNVNNAMQDIILIIIQNTRTRERNDQKTTMNMNISTICTILVKDTLIYP
jgi:hypothetical protein